MEERGKREILESTHSFIQSVSALVGSRRRADQDGSGRREPDASIIPGTRPDNQSSGTQQEEENVGPEWQQ